MWHGDPYTYTEYFIWTCSNRSNTFQAMIPTSIEVKHCEDKSKSNAHKESSYHESTNIKNSKFYVIVVSIQLTSPIMLSSSSSVLRLEGYWPGKKTRFCRRAKAFFWTYERRSICLSTRLKTLDQIIIKSTSPMNR